MMTQPDEPTADEMRGLQEHAVSAMYMHLRSRLTDVDEKQLYDALTEFFLGDDSE